MSVEPVVLDAHVASLSLKGKLPPDVLRQLSGRGSFITFVTLAELYDLPLATRNGKDFEDFAEPEGLRILGD